MACSFWTLAVLLILLNVVCLLNALFICVKANLRPGGTVHVWFDSGALNCVTSISCRLSWLLIQEVLKIIHCASSWIILLVGNSCLHIFMVLMSGSWSIPNVSFSLMSLHSSRGLNICSNSFSLLSEWFIHLILVMKHIMDVINFLLLDCLGVAELNFEVVGDLLSLFFSCHSFNSDWILNIGVTLPLVVMGLIVDLWRSGCCRCCMLHSLHVVFTVRICANDFVLRSVMDLLRDWSLLVYDLNLLLLMIISFGFGSTHRPSLSMLLSHLGARHSKLSGFFKLALSIKVLRKQWLLWPVNSLDLNHLCLSIFMMIIIYNLTSMSHSILIQILKLVMNHTYLVISNTESFPRDQTFDGLKLIE